MCVIVLIFFFFHSRLVLVIKCFVVQVGITLSAKVNISKTSIKLNERSEFSLLFLKCLRVLINPELLEQTI